MKNLSKRDLLSAFIAALVALYCIVTGGTLFSFWCGALFGGIAFALARAFIDQPIASIIFYATSTFFIWIAFFVIQIQRIPNNLFGALFGMFITIILTGLWFTTLDKLKEWVDKKGLK